MNLEKLAKALKIEVNINTKDVKYLRENKGMGMETARNYILELMIIERISQLVEKIERNNNGKNENNNDR